MSSEREDIKAAQANPEDFAILYNRYFETIFRFIYSRVNQETQTAEITSNVFTKTLLNLRKYKDRGFPFSSWLYRIAINEIQLYYRNKSKVVEVEINEQQIESLRNEIASDENEKQIKIDKLIIALECLNDTQNELIELRFFEQLSFKEIAGIYNISEANAKMKIYRIINKLKEEF